MDYWGGGGGSRGQRDVAPSPQIIGREAFLPCPPPPPSYAYVFIGITAVHSAFSKDKLLSRLSFSERSLGISVINDQKATVCTADKKLHILNISDPVNISIARSVFLGYLVVGMAQYNGNLIVTKFDEPQCVKMIDLNGEEKWSVSADHKGQQLFNTLHSITISTSNDTSTIIVSDWGKDTLTVFNSNDRHVIKTIDLFVCLLIC